MNYNNILDFKEMESNGELKWGDNNDVYISKYVLDKVPMRKNAIRSLYFLAIEKFDVKNDLQNFTLKLYDIESNDEISLVTKKSIEDK